MGIPTIFVEPAVTILCFLFASTIYIALEHPLLVFIFHSFFIFSCYDFSIQFNVLPLVYLFGSINNTKCPSANFKRRKKYNQPTERQTNKPNTRYNDTNRKIKFKCIQSN